MSIEIILQPISEIIASLAKEAGFDRSCIPEVRVETERDDFVYWPPVTLEHMTKWLREEHKIYMFSCPSLDMRLKLKWYVVVDGYEDGEEKAIYDSGFVNEGRKTYEESIEFGIIKALEHIINVKDK